MVLTSPNNPRGLGSSSFADVSTYTVAAGSVMSGARQPINPTQQDKVGATWYAYDGAPTRAIRYISVDTFGNYQKSNNQTFTATFNGTAFASIVPALDVHSYTNIAVTLKNNSSNKLISASIEFSPDAVSWETISSSFAEFAASAIGSIQINNNSRHYFRLRGVASGSGGANSGSIQAWIDANNA